MVLVVDFGSQYTELLVRQVRQNRIFAEIKNFDDPALIQEASKYQALILSGSPCCAKDELHEKIFRDLIEVKKPILCVCYGMQVMHKIMGGELVYGECSEFGSTEVRIVKNHNLVDGIPPVFTTWMSHNDSVIELAPNFKPIAKTNACYAIAADDKSRIYTIQFHPEVEHSNHGSRLITNFLLLICKLKPTWSLENIVEKKIEEIKRRVQDRPVYLAVSGGLDSSVVAKLLKYAQVDAHYIFINTGLMWDQKIAPILDWLKVEFKDRFTVIDAKDKFFGGLKGVIDPEQKRKKVGNIFIDVFSGEIVRDDNYPILAQGTIKSDLIESGKKNQSHKIKTHHNTISNLKKTFDILEPISDLFKDEVRSLAKKLDIPDFIVNSQPFPGPGYAIRIMGEVTEEKTETLKKIDHILMEELQERNLYDSVSQCFAVMINSKSVGVVGDRRSYGHVVAIRAVNSENMMTAKPFLIPIATLVEIGSKITNQIPEVSRIVYDLTSKPPATIEWE